MPIKKNSLNHIVFLISMLGLQSLLVVTQSYIFKPRWVSYIAPSDNTSLHISPRAKFNNQDFENCHCMHILMFELCIWHLIFVNKNTSKWILNFCVPYVMLCILGFWEYMALSLCRFKNIVKGLWGIFPFILGIKHSFNDHAGWCMNI